MSLKQELRGALTKKELALAPSAFDVLGSKAKAVAIIEIPDQLQKKENVIAEALMRKHKNVKSVLKKASSRHGVFRTRDYELLAGGEDTEVMHAESGCRMLVDPRACYFSQREATERLRIAEKVKKGEVVMVFFSGAGPFQVVIARKAKPKKVVGIEINEKAVYYARENARLNRIDNMEVVLGDARHEAQRFYDKCDRVVMPLPETAMDFLEDAVKCLKAKGIIHLYCLVKESNIPSSPQKSKIFGMSKSKLFEQSQRTKFFADFTSDAEEKKDQAISAIKAMGFHAEAIETKKVLPYGPRIWKMRIDIVVKKR